MTDVYFAGKRLAVEDRLGSDSNGRSDYFPYGETRFTYTGQVQRFATYTRDNSTGLDYAINRHYMPGTGRFTSADPYRASGGAGAPGSWNRYAYAMGDAVNLRDRLGLQAEGPQSPWIVCLPTGDGDNCEDYEVKPKGEPSNNGGTVWKYPKCNPNYSASEENALDYVKKHYGDATIVSSQVNAAFGLNTTAAWVIAWAAQETGWYGGNVAASNGNYFNMRAGNNWLSQSNCPPGADRDYACFASFQDSAIAAFFSPMLMPGYQSATVVVDNPSAGFILQDQLGQGATPAGAWQHVASGGTGGGFARPHLDYGTKMSATIDQTQRRVDCMKANDYL